MARVTPPGTCSDQCGPQQSYTKSVLGGGLDWSGNQGSGLIDQNYPKNWTPAPHLSHRWPAGNDKGPTSGHATELGQPH